jgi:predicted sulfurtransferase
MKKMGIWAISVAGLIFVLVGCFQNVAVETKTPRMAKEELKSLLGNPEVIVLDVRIADEWKKSVWKIKGAVREDPERDFKPWASKYAKDKTLVFY